MTQEQAQRMATQIGRIEGRVTSDRKSHAIQFQSINTTLDKLMSKMDKHLVDGEDDRLRIALLVEHLEQLKINTSHNVEVYQEQRDQIKKDILETAKHLNDYKDKMRYWEMFMNWAKVPFYTFMVWQIVHFREEISALWEIIVLKFSGVKSISK